MTREGLTQSPKIVRAEKILDLSKYESLYRSVLPLVATIEYLVETQKIKDPGIVEIGPVPTWHYKWNKFGDRYDSEQALKDAKSPEWVEDQTAPLRFIADMHPDWHLAAVSRHDIPEESKQALLGPHANLFMYDLGPQRKHGLNPEDVWDEEYEKNQGDIGRFYPKLIKQMGGKRPDIIYGRHVFDRTADEYPVGKLTTIASMLLPVGGLLVSHVFGSTDTDSHVPLGDEYHFPFDATKNMKLLKVVRFSRGKIAHYVYVYQKTGDAIRPS